MPRALQDLHRVTFKNREGKGDRPGGRCSSSSEVQFKCSGRLGEGYVVCGVWCVVCGVRCVVCGEP